MKCVCVSVHVYETRFIIWVDANQPMFTIDDTTACEYSADAVDCLARLLHDTW